MRSLVPALRFMYRTCEHAAWTIFDVGPVGFFVIVILATRKRVWQSSRQQFICILCQPPVEELVNALFVEACKIKTALSWIFCSIIATTVSDHREVGGVQALG